MGTAPTGMRSPLSGYNHNVRYNTRVYHVQTEDSGAANPHIFTHLFLQGMIVATLRTNYDPAEHEGQVRSVMQEQHKRIMKQLRRGEFDERIAALTGAEVAPIPAAVVEAAEAPAVAEAPVAAEAPAVEEEAATTEVPAVAAEAPAAEAPAALPAAAAPAAPPEPTPAEPEVLALAEEAPAVPEEAAAPPEPASTTHEMPAVPGVPAPEPALKTPPGGYPMVVGDDQRSCRTLIGYPALEGSGLPEVLLEGMTESEIRSIRRGQAISLGLTSAPEQVPVDRPVFDGFPTVELDLGDDDSLELDLEAITNLDLDSDQAAGGWEGLELDLEATPTPGPMRVELPAQEPLPALQGGGEDLELELDLAATDEEAAADLQEEEEEVSTEWDEPSLEWEPAPPEPSDEEKTGRRKRPSLPPAPVDPAGERKKRPSLPVAPVERVEIPVNVKSRPTGRGGKRGR